MDTNDALGPHRWLLDILHKGAESRDLDYKAPCVWDESDKACDGQKGDRDEGRKARSRS
jgi:hypothetical protein